MFSFTELLLQVLESKVSIAYQYDKYLEGMNTPSNSRLSDGLRSRVAGGGGG